MRVRVRAWQVRELAAASGLLNASGRQGTFGGLWWRGVLNGSLLARTVHFVDGVRRSTSNVGVAPFASFLGIDRSCANQSALCPPRLHRQLWASRCTALRHGMP